METIVFIGTNKSGSSREAIRASERLGFFTVLFTNKKQFLEQREEFTEVHQMVFSNIIKEELAENMMELQKQGKKIRLIVSFVDPYVHIAAALNERFTDSTVSSMQFLDMEDKIRTRNMLKHLPQSPYFFVYNPEESVSGFIKKINTRFPLIVKSPVSAGSKDVLYINSKFELQMAIIGMSKKYKNTPILVEEYLIGPQYLIEVIVHHGKINIAAVIKQETTFDQRFIVTGYSLCTKMDSRLHESIRDSVDSIVGAFKMEDGACHVEMKLVNGNWKLIEINPRISGGAMNRMIETGYGINLVEETLKLYLGGTPELTRKHNKFVYVHYITIDKRGRLQNVTGTGRALKHPGVEEVFIKPRKGKMLRPPLSMGDRYGYVMAEADSYASARKAALEAAKEISFNLESDHV
ncbi:ATP-grasp domain-containing protein [Metabacillus sp. 84]|uniref:ATP-grasp domain-containing protein n=1 Tax=Metabacillus sp. 84 TaxID=3404705 RepID=UPI003CE9162E